jgi:pimeloyl-ACP methyl ester carboxylesterase
MTGNKSVTANFAQASQAQDPVVLVHGWRGLPLPGTISDICDSQGAYPVTDVNNIPTGLRDFGTLPKWLLGRRDVWIAHIATGPNGTPPIEDNAVCLKNQLEQIPTPTGKFVLIGHSMGGLVIRAYVESGLYANNISQVITLGTPHVGTPYGLLACARNLIRPIEKHDYAACQFSIGGEGHIGEFNSHYSQRRSGVTYTFIGGNKTPFGVMGPVLKYLGTEGPNDGAVGAQSAIGRIYWPLLPPTEVVGGATRYIANVSHSSFEREFMICIPVPFTGQESCISYTVGFGQWFPSFFNAGLDDQTTPTEPIQCVLQLLGIPGGSCPSQATAPARAPRSTTSVVSRTPTLSGHFSTGQVVTGTVPVDTSGFSQFNLNWVAGTVGFTLRNPSGTVIDPAYAAAHPSEVVYTSNTTDPNSPLFASYTFATTVPGTYTLTITAGDVGASGTDYSTHALVDSPRVLTVTTNSTLYAVGSTATIAATLQNAGTGLTGAAVQARLYRTGVVSDTITLADQGGGNYTATYTIPNAPGYLGLSVIAQGNEAGTTYARQVDNLLAISPPTVQLTGQYADNAVDSDSNGKLDTLNLAIGVNSTQAGNYLLSGDLVGVGNVLVAHGVVSTTLTTGTITATLPFNGDDIQRSGLNGPYTLTNLTITDQQNGGVPAVWKAANVYTTSAYNFADFAATCFVLTTNATTGGTISANPSPNCNGGLQYTSGTTVTLTASPNTSYTFLNWSGDASGSSNPVTVTMNGDKTVGADFATRLYLPLILHNPVQESNPIYLPIILK